MGGGDLNMKKSWHPLLLKNQERVWLEEKKALEEKKKLDQLRKEKEEERQLQELQRLQEEQTGKKRTEKLEWMYATPATGTSQNPNDLEDYLLGKKRVDKILTADENAKVGASHKAFIAVQNANNARDIAAKIREDPLLAIKQQEQAAYQALLSNPLRLREMQERTGIKPKVSKEEKKREKEEKRRLKHERKQRRDNSPNYRGTKHRRSLSRNGHNYHERSTSPYGRQTHSDAPSRSHRAHYESRSPRRDKRSPSREYDSRRNYPSRSPRPQDRRPVWPRSDESDDNNGVRPGSISRYTSREKRARSRSLERRDRSPPLKRSRRSRSPLPYSNHSGDASGPPITPAEERTARLEAMTTNASAMSEERQRRLSALLEREKAELVAEEAARARSKGMGNFLSHEQKRVFGGSGGLEERIRRGRGGMVGNLD